MISNVEFIKSDVVKVVSKDKDMISFASDLRDSLDNFELNKIDGDVSISFRCKSIDFSTETGSEKSKNYLVYGSNKVLIKNKRIVMTDCKELIDHKLLNLVL